MSAIWSRIVDFILTIYVKHRCRKFIRMAGYSRCSSSDDWVCYQCDERLDDVMMDKIVHTFAGKTIKHSKMVATMCPRCAWISDGSMKIPIWKWLQSKGKGPQGREFFLKNERIGLRIRLAEIEAELESRKTLSFIDDDFKLRAMSLQQSHQDERSRS